MKRRLQTVISPQRIWPCRRSVLLGVVLLLTACGTTHRHHRYSQAQDGAPDYKIDASAVPDATPKVEPLSKHGNPKKYTVLGKTYYLRSSFVNYDETGIASWYGTKFHSYKTSSGETYDLAKMTAAHKTLPIPCYAKVTNLSNGKQVIVKINDRGPFAENRVMDLSYVAAIKLGIWPKGTGLVRIQTIDPSQEQHLDADAGQVQQVPVNANPQIYMQLGAFQSKQNAEHLMAQMSSVTHKPICIRRFEKDGVILYKVRIGPLANVDTSDELNAAILQAQLGKPMTVIE